MFIQRTLLNTLLERLSPGKAVLLLGPGQVGKSTLLEQIAGLTRKKILRLDCDDAAVRMRLEIQQLANLRQLIGEAELVLIDEAQRVKNIGLTLKIITD